MLCLINWSYKQTKGLVFTPVVHKSYCPQPKVANDIDREKQTVPETT